MTGSSCAMVSDETELSEWSLTRRLSCSSVGDWKPAEATMLLEVCSLRGILTRERYASSRHSRASCSREGRTSRRDTTESSGGAGVPRSDTPRSSRQECSTRGPWSFGANGFNLSLHPPKGLSCVMSVHLQDVSHVRVFGVPKFRGVGPHHCVQVVWLEVHPVLGVNVHSFQEIRVLDMANRHAAPRIRRNPGASPQPRDRRPLATSQQPV